MKLLRLVLGIFLAVMVLTAIPFTALAADPAPTVTSITPNTSVNNKALVIDNLAGTGFVAGATVKLTRTGEAAIDAVNLDVVSSTQITCSFDFYGQTAGTWNVVVTNADGQSGTLANGFTLTKPEPVTKLNLTTTYPKLEVDSGSTAAFEVKVGYTNTNEGAKAKIFDISATAPKDWTTYVTPQYPTDKKIASMQLDPASTVGETLIVNVAPPYFSNPEPGEYKVTLNVNSGDLKESIDLIVNVKAKYSVTMEPSGTLYNTKVTAGKNNYFSVTTTNSGSAPLSNVTFSSDKPQDWAIDFPSQKIDTLNSGGTQTLDVNIKPPAKAIAGDYVVTLRASGTEASAQDLQIRVTVETPTLWGWIGVGIIVLVIGGISFIFMRFSRR